MAIKQSNLSTTDKSLLKGISLMLLFQKWAYTQGKTSKSQSTVLRQLKQWQKYSVQLPKIFALISPLLGIRIKKSNMDFFLKNVFYLLKCSAAILLNSNVKTKQVKYWITRWQLFKNILIKVAQSTRNRFYVLKIKLQGELPPSYHILEDLWVLLWVAVCWQSKCQQTASPHRSDWFISLIEL